MDLPVIREVSDIVTSSGKVVAVSQGAQLPIQSEAVNDDVASFTLSAQVIERGWERDSEHR
jgi:hypothetical protein